MSAKQSKGSARAYATLPFKGFVNYSMDKAQLDELKSLTWTPADFVTEIERWLNSGMTIKFSEDNYNNCIQCVLGRSDGTHVDAGWFLTGRGSDVVKALKQAIYIHAAIDGSWDNFMMINPKRYVDWE